MLFWHAQRICRWSRTRCSATGRGGVVCLCDQRPCLAGHEKKINRCCTNHPDLPTCKAKADDWGLRLGSQDYLHVLYASQVALQYTVLKPQYKQASLRNSTRSLIERGTEPLGNLNKGCTERTTCGLPFTTCVNARACTRFVTILSNLLLFPNNSTNNHELHQGLAPPGLTYLTYRWRVKQSEGKTKHKRDTTLCICVYV